MKSIKVSVIISVYNEEKYLEESIKSVINQTLKDIEIIIINDGSQDSSKDICERFAKQDPRIIFIDKENGGIADVRNTGLKIATGKYVMFLDGDDFFEIDSCENMYNAIEKSNADYATGNYVMTDENGSRWPKPAFDVNTYQEFKLNKNDFEKSFFVMNSTSWNKIYRMQFLKDNDIKFKIPSPSEDDYFTSLCYMKANYGFYTPKVMYLYRNRPNSLSKDCSFKYFKGINSAYKTIYETFKNNNEINYYRYVYAKKNAYLLCQLIDSKQVSDKEKIECLKELEWYFNLGDELKINTAHESLRKLIDLIKDKNYDDAIVEMNKIKEYRMTIPDNIKKRMSFPTKEDYEKMREHDKEFNN